ncbi:chromatin modification-related protein EAF1 B-like isoform X2 [Cynara cardunculus var. scolymus]|uniref:chromatin modification-related protein EAF1 B-like isoform X2 n=1 Tax=Cynara cardunculus var. scolymus TaxID=59895 RepID=UPI000D62B4A6|nr:chromatin modification-related protein EAF1 B-like isoform X2 [Cynara cardunculus var. scolymus]
MHGCTSGSLLLVDAGVDSMGGVIDGGVEISSAPSPQQSSDLEKTQAELRETFTAAEKFRRELEFLQKGGDPLDLKIGTATTVSLQSTSLTDQHPEHFVTSDVKGSFAITASPHGDSVESSGRLGAPSAGEPNSADNLMLFDGDNKFREVERRSLHPRTNNTPSEHYSQLDVGRNGKESGESVALELPKKSYKRRIRSRPNRDGARSSSTDAGPRSGQSFFPSRHAARDAKGLVHDADNQEQKYLSNSNSKTKSPNVSLSPKNLSSNSRVDVKSYGMQTQKSTLGPTNGPLSAVSDASASQHPQEDLFDQPLTSDTRETPLSMSSVEPGSVGRVELENLSGSEHLPGVDKQTVGNLALLGQTNVFGNTGEKEIIPNDCNGGAPSLANGFNFKSSCSQTDQSLDGNNKNESLTSIRNFNANGIMELNLSSKEVLGVESNDLNTVKDDKILNIGNDNSNPHPPSRNENGSTLKEEEGLKGSDNALQHELKEPVSSTGCTSFQESTLSHKCSTDGAQQNTFSKNSLKLATKEHEDSILEEARIIEEKRKRIAGMSVGIFSSEGRHRSHWHFVLEEMSWLANDFAQERLWKVTAAAQISRNAAYTSRVRFQQQNSLWKQKEVAHTLAEAVMEFWHTVQVKCQGSELEGLKKDSMLGLRQYGMRFLEYNTSHAQYSSAQAPVTPDRISDLGSIDISWEDNLTEEDLFYTVPPGAIEAYRKSIQSHLLQCERTGSSMQEEVDASGYDAVAAFGSQDNTLEEEEGETSTYYLPGAFEGSRSSKTAQKKRKQFRSYGARSYEMGVDLSFMQPLERNIGIQPSVLSGKRPASSINVSIPTKRVRTASRQRFSGTSGYIQASTRADASSGDTNSFQDEQSSLHGGPQIPSNMEAESVGDYEKQWQFDMTEVSNQPKKKKKAKHPGSTYEHRWPLDSNIQNDQKDHSKRRLDTRQFDSNGNSGASQMNNMSNPNKFMKLLVRDRGRKAKSLKTPAGQQGSGSPWSLFEDQALVVLVHDMGANWELISDAINSTLQFKCISRNSKECKERHKILMDRNTGDGADSAEDSGSSQPYPSTLPGIPEGSARQLFQRLQGPMEEDTLKYHFEKMIMIWQKHHYRKAQNDNQDPKQLQQPHGSHALALSQVCPNNLNGGPVLTPLDLCDAISSSPDFLPIGYQGPHTGGLPVPNHGNAAPMVPGSSSASSLPGSSNMVHGSHLVSASAPLSPSVREGRYGIPRTGSLSIDDQHRMQQYNQMLSARNIQQSSLPSGTHSGTDRGVRMLPGGNGTGVMNRNMTMTRPGFQGIASPSMLSSGVGMPTAANIQAGAGPSQGNSVRPREALHMTRPNQNTDHQRQIMAPDLQMQQVPPGGMGSFPNQNSQPPVLSYPLHQQQQAHPMSPQQSPRMPNSNSHPHHATNAQHPSYGMRFIKERQLQQHRLLQQQFGTSNPMMPHGQPQQSQLPVSSPQSSTQIQTQSSPPVSVSPIGTPSLNPMPQHPQKHPAPPLLRNPQTGGNQAVKLQRHRQPPQFQQPGRQHPQVSQSQQQAKVMKGGSSLLNGVSGGQSVAEKGEPRVMHHLLQSGQGNVYSGPSAKQMPHSSLNQSQQQKRYPSQPQKPSLSSDTSNIHAPPSVMTSTNHRQPQPPQKLVGQTQATPAQRMVQNRKANSSDLPTSKVQATNTTVSLPQVPSNDATSSESPVAGAGAGAPNWKTSEPFYDSGVVSDNATQFGKGRTGLSPPQSSSAGTGSEHSGPTVNHGGGVHKQSSSDSLPNSIGRDTGVQWQQQPSS